MVKVAASETIAAAVATERWHQGSILPVDAHVEVTRYRTRPSLDFHGPELT